MRPLKRAPLALLAALAGPASAAIAGVQGNMLEYGCDDLVVSGRVENLSYESLDLEGDLIGHGSISAHLEVRQVHFGRWRERIVFHYVAHGFLREDRDFVFVIGRDEDGEYFARSIRTDRRIHMAPACKAAT